MSSRDPNSLDRFLHPQDRDWPQVTAELRAGQKASHWMWYVFPQLRGLGLSQNATFWGIADGAEARAYLDHPVLGIRLTEVFGLVLGHADKSAKQILGQVDSMKLRSSATLFALAGEGGVFDQTLDTFFGGVRCERTLDLLGSQA